MPRRTALKPDERGEIVERAKETTYDLVVIGGGIAGAGVARDAARRGLDTLLVEQTDFGSGTTAGSTRLIHGGLRYLEHLEFGLVFESLQERETVAEIAPHLVDPLGFLIPQYDESRLQRVKLGLGMYLYDVLSYGKTMPSHERLSGDEVAELEPSLPEAGLQSGFLYHDRQCAFVERLCLENIIDAATEGADVLNHAEVTSLRTGDDQVTGVTVQDRLTDTTFEVESHAVVNTAGPWADAVAPNGIEDQLVRPAKGIHIVVPSLTDHAVTLPTTDSRVVFIVPWNGYSLIGTTDTDFDGDPGDAVATPSDVTYLLDEIGSYFDDITEDDILYAYAGVRPLYDSGGQGNSASVSREHKVIHHTDEYTGLFSLVGAKITPYRRAAEELTDAVTEYLDAGGSCVTAEVPLPGARGSTSSTSSLSDDNVTHLESLYGTRIDALAERVADDERLGEPLCEHTDDILAQVTVAVEEEYARRVTDVMFQRCTVGFAECEGRDAVDTVADHMAELLEWGPDRKREEIERYEAVIDQRHAFEDDRKQMHIA